MTNPSPLQMLQLQAEAEFIHYGREPIPNITTKKHTGEDGQDKICPGTDLVVTYGELELEYAALRKAVGFLDMPQRAVIRIEGADRIEFLDRIVSNKITGDPNNEFTSTRAFLLNRLGRIQADLQLLQLTDYVLIDVDIHQAAELVKNLEQFLFSEDVQIKDISDDYHRFALHGPKSSSLLYSFLHMNNDDSNDMTDKSLSDLAPAQVMTTKFDGYELIIERRDTTGEIGLEVYCPVNAVVAFYEQIMESGSESETTIRPIGWMAYNMARIENGTALFNIDFGPDALPHETGTQTLNNTVSFKKGCYPGQEIVARMHNLGKPKKVLAGLKIMSESMPDTGCRVFSVDIKDSSGTNESDNTDKIDGDYAEIGAVTSATPCPMLGNINIAYAMIAFKHYQPGNVVLVETLTGERVEAEIIEGLRFWDK